VIGCSPIEGRFGVPIAGRQRFAPLPPLAPAPVFPGPTACEREDQTRPGVRAPYRAPEHYVATPAANDITQRCLGRILLWKAEQGDVGARQRTSTSEGLHRCVPGGAVQRAASRVVQDSDGRRDVHGPALKVLVAHGPRDALIGSGLSLAAAPIQSIHCFHRSIDQTDNQRY
jgi:hypothetical protein